MIDIAKS